MSEHYRPYTESVPIPFEHFEVKKEKLEATTDYLSIFEDAYALSSDYSKETEVLKSAASELFALVDVEHNDDSRANAVTAVKSFFNDLIEFASSKSGSGRNEQEKLETLGSIIEGVFLDQQLSKKLLTIIPAEDVYLLTSKFARIIEFRKSISYKLQEQLLQNSRNFENRNFAISMAEKVVTLPQVDGIELLFTLANGGSQFNKFVDSFDADDHKIIENLLLMFKEVEHNTKFRLQSIVAEQLHKEIHDNYTVMQNHMYHISNDNDHFSEISEKKLALLDRLGSIQFDREMDGESGEGSSLIAKDAVALCEFGTPRLIGLISNANNNDDEIKLITFEHLASNRVYNPSHNSHMAESISLLQYLHQPIMERYFENEFRIDFSQISLRAQVEFLKELSTKDKDSFDLLKSTISQWMNPELRNSIIESYLSLAESSNYADDILLLSHGFLGEEVLANILYKYQEIVDTTHSIENYIQESLVDPSVSDISTISQVSHGLVSKANTLLHDFSIRIQNGSYDEVELLAELKQVSVDILLFTSTFKTLFKKSQTQKTDFSFTELKNTDLALVSAKSLVDNQDRVADMKAIIRTNYKDAGYPHAFIEKIVASFENTITPDSSTHYYMVNHGKELVSFNRFDDHYGSKGELSYRYFGSFNLNKKYGRANIGEALMEQSLINESENGKVPIFADCDPKAGITKKYIEFGFVAYDIYELEGVESFSIDLDKSLNNKLVSKSWTQQEVVSKAVQSGSGDDIKIFANNSPDFSLLKNNYLLTHYFIGTDKKTYTVFERHNKPEKPNS